MAVPPRPAVAPGRVLQGTAAWGMPYGLGKASITTRTGEHLIVRRNSVFPQILEPLTWGANPWTVMTLSMALVPAAVALHARVSPACDVGVDANVLGIGLDARCTPWQTKDGHQFGASFGARGSRDSPDETHDHDVSAYEGRVRIEVLPPATARRGFIFGGGVSSGLRLHHMSLDGVVDFNGEAFTSPTMRFTRQETRLEALAGVVFQGATSSLTLALQPTWTVAAGRPDAAFCTCSGLGTLDAFEETFGVTLFVAVSL